MHRYACVTDTYAHALTNKVMDALNGDAGVIVVVDVVVVATFVVVTTHEYLD